MGYSTEQKKVAAAIARQGRKYHANRTQLLAAYDAALTEAALKNPNYGDRDSLGPFQQRSSWGSASQRTNPDYAAALFFKSAKGVGGKLHPGELAQAVQRSAFPGRYATHTKEAAGLIAQFAGGKAPAKAPSSPGSKSKTVTVSPAVDNSGARSALLTQYLSSRPADASKDTGGNLLNLGLSLKDAQDIPAKTKTVKTPSLRQVANAGPGGYHFVVGRKHMFSEGRTDRGQDFETNPGGTVNAIGNAKVVATSGVFPGKGPVLQLLDGPYKGRYVFYGHMRASLVKAGQIVKAGQPVAIAGGVGGGGPGHAEVGFALDASGRIDMNVGSDHYSSKTGQPFHDLLYKANPKRVRRKAIRSG